MAKFTGRTKGLDPKKLAALEKVLREAGIKGNIGINSGLRNVDKAYELYQLDLKKRFPKLKLSMEKLPESSRKAIRERMLRGEYKGKGKPVKNLYPRNAWNRKGLVKQLIKDGLSAVESQKIADQVAKFRKQNAGLGSTHLKGEKVDINRSLLNKPGVKKLLVDKGYVILDEDDKKIWDISFPKPGRKGSYEILKGKGKVKKSKPKSASKADMSNRFLIPEDKSLIPKWMKEHGYNKEDMQKPDGSWYHPGEAMEPVDPKFEDVEEFEEFKMDEVLKSPQPDFILPDAPPPNPYGVYAQGEPEFEMAEDEQMEEVMMAADGGEVEEEGRVVQKHSKNPDRGEYRTRKGGARRNTAFDRLSEEAKQLPFKVGSVFEEYDPNKKDQDYYGVGIEGGWETLREAEGGRDGKQREVTKDVLRVQDPLFRVKHRRNPKTGKVEKYVEAEEDAPWYEGGAFPRRRSISISGGRRKGDFDIPEASEFRDRERAERLSKISPYERLEGEGMVYGEESGEFGTELHDVPTHGRGFKDMPKKARKGLRRMAGYGDAGDLQLRYFGEAFDKADKAGKARLAKANPELAQEFKQRMGFQEGGEVEEDFFMEEEVSEAVPRYLQRPEEGQQEEDFKLSGIDDIVSGLEKTSAKAGEEELKKADQIIEEDVEAKVDAGPEMEREQLRIESMSDQELRDYPATAAGRPTAVNEEIRRRKSEIKEQAGIERSPTLDEMVEVEKKDVRVDEGIEELVKGPKVPKGDVSKREPEVRVVSESEKRREALDRQKAELDAKIEEFQNKESKFDAIDNQRFFNKGGTLNKIISMVAAGFGGYASGRYGGPNVYLDLIDKEVKSDIQQQKLDREDEVAKQNAAYKKIKQLADRYKMSVDNDFAQKKLDMLSKKMDQKIAVNRNKLAVNVMKQQDYGRITRPLSRADFTALDFKYPKMKLRDRAMTGRDGQVYIVDSADTKKKLEEQIENNTGAVQAIDQLIELTPKLSMFEKFPGAGRFSVNRKVADATRAALVGKLRLELFGPGVMTDTEREQAKKIIGDPGALLELDATKIAALQNIRWKLKYAERERLRRSGVQVPMSRNDLKVENRLKYLGYPPFAKASPRQRRRAMDILINAEKAAMRKAKAGKPQPGYYKGKYWDKDEQNNF